MQHHYIGLTDEQVLLNRKNHGINILTPPTKKTWRDKLLEVVCHKISILLFSIIAISFVASLKLLADTDMGSRVFVMPTMFSVSTFFVMLVGYFGGYKDPLFKILITAFILSMFISLYEYVWCNSPFSTFYETIGIIFALLLATGVSFFLERKNEKIFQSLNQVDDNTLVKVVRNDNVCQVARKDIVIDDIILLDTGEEVPADCQLLESTNLIVNESSLTGELQTNKTTDAADFDKSATYPSNQILKGTTIIEGNCIAQVVKVGDKTECGKVFEASQVQEGSPTPLSHKLQKLSKQITIASYLIASLILVGRTIIYFTSDITVDPATAPFLHFIKYFLETIMISITLIVVAVPEGLPMSISLSLAFSMRRLMKEHTLPRTMHSCETMGAASVICTDKTGTLTQNQMQVSGQKFGDIPANMVYEMIASNSTANLDYSDADNIKPVGNPTECALLLWMENKGVKYGPLREIIEIVDRLPFSTSNKYMATIVRSREALGKNILYVKGAPELLISMSTLSSDDKRDYEDSLRSYQLRGMRTLGMAYAIIDETEQVFTNNSLSPIDLTFAGIFAISDPVREDVPSAISECLSAGISIKIVTGDTSLTAIEIGRQVGLWTDSDDESNVLSGSDFSNMSDQEANARLSSLKILSRARPSDKERLVRLLKKSGEVVAVTGDGTNDAPALNTADVGLSMGDGTAVAKEASDMTILNNSFSTIADAVMWGRSLYKNIQRFIMFQMSINVIACAVVLIGAFTGKESPLTVTQMLWVNLIMDTFAAIALASLPPTHTVMFEKPRKNSDNIITRNMWTHILSFGCIVTLILLYFLSILKSHNITSLNSIFNIVLPHTKGINMYEQGLFFTLFVMFQYWNLFNAKAYMTGDSAFKNIKKCHGFIITLFIILTGQILMVQLGGEMFNVSPLCLIDWIIIITLSSMVLFVGEFLRQHSNRMSGIIKLCLRRQTESPNDKLD